MNLIQYIKELLYQQECVTLPGFGSFLTQTHPIKVNRFTGEFTPPSRTISFNRLIQENDGLLASYVAKREGVSYPDALVMIEKELQHWNRRLDRETMILPGIGEFSLMLKTSCGFYPTGRSTSMPMQLASLRFNAPQKKHKFALLPLCRQRHHLNPTPPWKTEKNL